MFLSKLFSIFKRKKPEGPNMQSEARTTIPTASTAAGATASGMSTSPNSDVSSTNVSPSEPGQVVDATGPSQASPGAQTPDDGVDVAQADTPPLYPGEETSNETIDSTDIGVEPEEDSYQNGPVQEPSTSPEEPQTPQTSPETEESSSDSIGGNDSDNENTGSTSGPTFG